MNFTDHDELDRRMRRRQRRQRSDIFWNFMTVLTLLATMALVGALLIIYSNPFVSINPFPPPTLPALVILPTSTATAMILPPTWTPPVVNVTETPLPPTATVETVLPSETLATSVPATDSGLYTFALQAAPSAVSSVTFKASTGCIWQGIAGQVVDMQGKHLPSIGIVLKGTYDGKTVEIHSLSGTHTEYGDSGYEFQLGATPIASAGLLSIQLVDPSGLPLSDQVIFDTYSACDKNLVLINFRQVK